MLVSAFIFALLDLNQTLDLRRFRGQFAAWVSSGIFDAINLEKICPLLTLVRESLIKSTEVNG